MPARGACCSRLRHRGKGIRLLRLLPCPWQQWSRYTCRCNHTPQRKISSSSESVVVTTAGAVERERHGDIHLKAQMYPSNIYIYISSVYHMRRKSACLLREWPQIGYKRWISPATIGYEVRTYFPATDMVSGSHPIGQTTPPPDPRPFHVRYTAVQQQQYTRFREWAVKNVPQRFSQSAAPRRMLRIPL